MSDLVLYDVRDRIALITVNDPDRRNAANDAMSAQLRDAVGAAEADTGVHAVVVTGAGKAFCAGADLSALGVAAREGRTDLRRVHGGRPLLAADHRCRWHRRRGGGGPEPGIGGGRPDRWTARDVRPPVPEAWHPSRWRRDLDAAAGGRATGRPRRTVVRDELDAEPAARHGLALSVADDPVAAALELAAGPASAPREVVLATKAAWATASRASMTSPTMRRGQGHRDRTSGRLGGIA